MAAHDRLAPRRVNVSGFTASSPPRRIVGSLTLAAADLVDTETDPVRRLLVVDDEPVQCLIITRAMTSFGFAADSAPSPGAVRRTPIVGLTAGAERGREAACREAGMDGFVSKPVTAERLAAAIEEIIVPDEGDAAMIDGCPMLDETMLRRLPALLRDGVALLAAWEARQHAPAV